MNEQLILLIAIFIFGSIFGSFLNVCIYRIPRKESIATAPSHCTSCGERIKPYDLIPILSYIFLGGKCRACRARISARYPLVELLNALGYVLIFTVFGNTPWFYFGAVMYSALIVITFTDIDTMEIPNEVIIFLLIVGVAFNLTQWDWWVALDAFIGFFAASVTMFLLGSMFGEGIGGGDVKLMAVCGLFLGWANILLAMFLGAFVACTFVAVQALAGKREKGAVIKFGPFLALGIMTAYLYGDCMVTAYLSLMGL